MPSNPEPQVQAVALTPRLACHVVDDALADPRRGRLTLTAFSACSRVLTPATQR